MRVSPCWSMCLVLALTACGDDKKSSNDKADAGAARDAASGDAASDAGMVAKGPVPLDTEVPLGKSCEGKSKPGVDGPKPTFTRQTIGMQVGAAYLKPVDTNHDGYPELLLTTLTEGVDPEEFKNPPPIAAGAGYLLSREGGKPTDGTLGTFTEQKLFDKTAKAYFANMSELLDVDNDGIKDWVVGGGFLVKPFASLTWVKGTETGFVEGGRAIPVPDPSCWYHETLPIDVDGDGDEDFVTTCHVGDTKDKNGPSRVEWFENPGDDSGAFTKHDIGPGGGTLLALYDLDQDGDQDVVLAQYFDPETLIWYEQTEAKGAAWTKHLINDTMGHGFMVKFADMNGDGKMDMVAGNHNNEDAVDPKNKTMGIYWFDLPEKDAVRTISNWDTYKHTVYEGFMVAGENNEGAGAPGVLNVGDIDGDCDIDVVASGDGDLGLYLLLQQANGFELVELSNDKANENSGQQHIYDADGDGDMDIAWAVFGPMPKGPSESIQSVVSVFVQN